MSPNINILWLAGCIMLIMWPVSLYSQKPNREQMLITDIERLGERAVRDMVISDDERKGMIGFIKDSLPESIDQRIKVLEQIRDELDCQYEEMILSSQKVLDEAGYIGNNMLPDLLYEPEDYISPQERNQARRRAAAINSQINIDEITKHLNPLKMKPWLATTLRMLFGRGVSQRPSRWDQITVPQMGGVYDIILPGRYPETRRDDFPKMEYDPREYH